MLENDIPIITILQGDQTGQELLDEALRLIAPAIGSILSR
jgi:hypothetical protein